MYLFVVDCFDQHVLRLDVAVKVAALVQHLEPQNDLAEILRGPFKREDLVGLRGLEVHEIPAIAILQHHVKVVLILDELVKFDDVLVVNLLHAGHLSLQVFKQMLILTDHLLLVDDLQCKLLLFCLDEEDIPEGPLSQLAFAGVLAQKDAIS